jgi:hypothetical protein
MEKTDKIRLLELQLKLLKAKGNTSPKAKATIEEVKAKSERWFKDKLNLTIVSRGLKVALPTKNGTQTYEGVKLSNGKTAVYLKSGYLKYSWA